MIFHSLDFVGFFIAVVAVYWALPHRAQNLFLLAASWFFYGYISPWFLGPLLVATATDFLVARGMTRWPARRKALLLMSVAVNLTMLGVFKYFGFFVENINSLLGAWGLGTFEPALSLVLPVGISFYTLQSIGYSVDVYRERLPACRRFSDYALYVAFFPQLVAGPIERSTHLLPEITAPRSITAARILSGLQLMLWGFFKKLVIADNAAVTANKIFALSDPNFALLWVGVFAFAIQIYADFSAYTDIARGAARVLGFELMENFRGPYLSQTPHEFWGRWHISLSSWIRDYVYIPLGGSRRGPARNAINLFLAFAVSGLWHGAQWNFVLWGLYWWALTIVYRAVGVESGPVFARPTSALRAMVRIAILFVLTCIGWLLFRETNPEYLAKFLTLDPRTVNWADFQTAFFLLILTTIYALPMLIYDVLCRLPAPWIARWQASIVPRRWIELATACALYLAILVLRSTTQADFIYFQF